MVNITSTELEAILSRIVNEKSKILSRYKKFSSDTKNSQTIVKFLVDSYDTKLRKKLLSEIYNELKSHVRISEKNNLQNVIQSSLSSIGHIEIKNLKTKIVVKPFILKIKPLDIKPKIADGNFKSPNEIYDSVVEHIKKLDLDNNDKEFFLDVMKNTKDKENIFTVTDGNVGLLSSEFYEILCALKMSFALLNHNTNNEIVDVFPKEMLNKINSTNIEIKFPSSSKHAVTDFYIKINGYEEIKFSVKKSPSTGNPNTLKFKDVFSDVKEVEEWIRNHSEQKGQGIIANSAAQVRKDYVRKDVIGIPLFAVKNLLKNKTQRYKISKIIREELPNVDILSFIHILNIICHKIEIVNAKTDIENDFIKSDKSLIKDSKEILRFQEHFDKIKDALNQKIKNSDQKITVQAFSHLCEIFLEKISKNTNQTNYNFYDMFFERILTKHGERGGVFFAYVDVTEKQIKYNYYSSHVLEKMKNERGTWKSLRSKNTFNSGKDTIGIDLS